MSRRIFEFIAGSSPGCKEMRNEVNIAYLVDLNDGYIAWSLPCWLFPLPCSDSLSPYLPNLHSWVERVLIYVKWLASGSTFHRQFHGSLVI